jgi:zinc D-Ala-D-Ala dipeptidase
MNKLVKFLVVVALGLAGASVSRGEEKKPSDFVDVAVAIPGIVVDLAYAGSDNFFRQRFYSSNRCFLRRSTVEKLRAAQVEFGQSGLRLKILDGYRPLSVQQQFWKVKPDARYVAPPTQGSRHNRGAAVDVTLVDQNGRELVMPTGFDDFTPKAAANAAASPEAVKNRTKLQQVMTRHGFVIMNSEWWHFDDSDWQSFPVADVSVEDLAARPENAAPVGSSETIKGQVATPPANGAAPGKAAAEDEVSQLRKRVEALEERVRILEAGRGKVTPP